MKGAVNPGSVALDLLAVELHPVLGIGRDKRRSRDFRIAAISEDIVAIGNRSSEESTGLIA